MRFLSGGDASLEFPNSKSQTRVTGTFRVASPGHQEIKYLSLLSHEFCVFLRRKL